MVTCVHDSFIHPREQLSSMSLELVVLGVGAGSTHTYTGECSSSFMLCLDGTPILMLDVVRC